MALTRRQLLQCLAATACGGSILQALEEIAHALAEHDAPSPVIWINEGGDHLNFLGQLGSDIPTLLELAVTRWNLVHYEPLGVGATETMVAPNSAAIVILEVLPAESVPAHPDHWPFNAIAQAKALILLGSDACFGGVRWPNSEVERLERYCREHSTPVIKLPGVPVPPHHLLGTLGHLELVGFPRLDRFRRPTLYYGETVCQRCERRGDLERGHFAEWFGDAGCLALLGCKGPITHNSCAVQKWNGGVNWCVGAGAPCAGCSEPGYPHHGGLGLYGRLPGDRMGMHSALLQNTSTIGWVFFALAGLGVGLKILRDLVAPRKAGHVANSAVQSDRAGSRST